MEKIHSVYLSLRRNSSAASEDSDLIATERLILDHFQLQPLLRSMVSRFATEYE